MKNRNMVLAVVVSIVLAIVALFFDSHTAKFFYIAASLIVAVVYVNMIVSSKKKMAIATGSNLSIIGYFRNEMSMLFMGLALLLFTTKIILQIMGVSENIASSLHLASLAFVILSAYARTTEYKKEMFES